MVTICAAYIFTQKAVAAFLPETRFNFINHARYPEITIKADLFYYPQGQNNCFYCNVSNYDR